MARSLILSPSALRHYTSETDLASVAHALLEQQRETWELLRNGYRSLQSVQSKTFELDDQTLRVQFNPGRLASSSAAVDEESIRQRKCFLCLDHLPADQRGIAFGEEYVILCNPFPIFPEHFTIPHIQHIPQLIAASFPVLLQLGEKLAARYTVFYNGPRCGASAPDHLHFQAGLKGFMPLEYEYDAMITGAGEKLADINGLLVFAVGRLVRKFIAIEGDDPDLLSAVFSELYQAAAELAGSAEEPMMNILCSYDEGEWHVVIFPRAKHRPSFFYEEGDGKILISPAAVDLGGVVITPVEKDFQRVDEEVLEALFREVCLSANDFDRLVEILARRLQRLRVG